MGKRRGKAKGQRKAAAARAVERPILDLSRVRQAIDALVHEAGSREVTWFGTVRESDGLIQVERIWVCAQKVSGASVDGILDLPDNLTDDEVQRVRYQGHSHVEMGVSPSGTDYESWAELVRLADAPFYFTVHNKRGEVSAHVGAPLPYGLPVAFTDKLAVRLLDESIVRWAQQEISSKLKPVQLLRPKAIKADLTRNGLRPFYNVDPLGDWANE